MICLRLLQQKGRRKERREGRRKKRKEKRINEASMAKC